MKPHLLVHAPGLTAEAACRGDLAANLSDLIAEGSFAEFSGDVDLAAAAAALGTEAVTIPCAADSASFDAALGDLRRRHPGVPVVVLSETLLISQSPFPEATLAVADIPQVLASMAD